MGLAQPRSLPSDQLGPGCGAFPRPHGRPHSRASGSARTPARLPGSQTGSALDQQVTWASSLRDLCLGSLVHQAGLLLLHHGVAGQSQHSGNESAASWGLLAVTAPSPLPLSAPKPALWEHVFQKKTRQPPLCRWQTDPGWDGSGGLRPESPSPSQERGRGQTGDSCKQPPSLSPQIPK